MTSIKPALTACNSIRAPGLCGRTPDATDPGYPLWVDMGLLNALRDALPTRLGFALVVASLGNVHASALADEYQVKAAMLYNFAMFVEWPAQAFRSTTDPIVVCVLGQNPFGSALEDAVRGKTVGGRAFAVRQIHDLGVANACHILFVGSTEYKALRASSADLKMIGVLTVGEGDGFRAVGGIINFKLEDGRVHFEINREAAEQARLHISSKLLSLAQTAKR